MEKSLRVQDWGWLGAARRIEVDRTEMVAMPRYERERRDIASGGHAPALVRPERHEFALVYKAGASGDVIDPHLGERARFHGAVVSDDRAVARRWRWRGGVFGALSSGTR